MKRTLKDMPSFYLSKNLFNQLLLIPTTLPITPSSIIGFLTFTSFSMPLYVLFLSLLLFPSLFSSFFFSISSFPSHAPPFPSFSPLSLLLPLPFPFSFPPPFPSLLSLPPLTLLLSPLHLPFLSFPFSFPFRSLLLYFHSFNGLSF